MMLANLQKAFKVCDKTYSNNFKEKSPNTITFDTIDWAIFFGNRNYVTGRVCNLGLGFRWTKKL